jgi:hypothetical protein
MVRDSGHTLISQMLTEAWTENQTAHRWHQEWGERELAWAARALADST